MKVIEYTVFSDCMLVVIITLFFFVERYTPIYPNFQMTIILFRNPFDLSQFMFLLLNYCSPALLSETLEAKIEASFILKFSPTYSYLTQYLIWLQFNKTSSAVYVETKLTLHMDIILPQ
jgi:hypothetical protein